MSWEAGWQAGLRGDDPRTCPYEPMTREWREWQLFHGWAVELWAALVRGRIDRTIRAVKHKLVSG